MEKSKIPDNNRQKEQIKNLFENSDKILKDIEEIHKWVNSLFNKGYKNRKKKPEQKRKSKRTIFYEEGESLLYQIREDLTGIKVNYLVAKTRADSKNIGDDYRTFLEDQFLNIQIYKQLEEVPKAIKGKTFIIDPSKIQDFQKERDEIIDLIRIKNRILQVQNFYSNSKELDSFTTVYVKNNTNIEKTLQLMTKLGISPYSIQQPISSRYRMWIHDINTKDRGSILSQLVGNNKIGYESYQLYAFKENLYAPIGVNAGQALEAMVHSASILKPNTIEDEYTWAEQYVDDFIDKQINKDFSKYDFDVLKGRQLDYSMILASKGNTELFRGGDVSFELYRKREGTIESYIKDYQVKGDAARVSFQTIENGLLLIDNFFYGTTRQKEEVQDKNNINNVNNLKQIFWDEVLDLSKFSDEVKKMIVNNQDKLEQVIKLNIQKA